MLSDLLLAGRALFGIDPQLNLSSSAEGPTFDHRLTRSVNDLRIMATHVSDLATVQRMI